MNRMLRLLVAALGYAYLAGALVATPIFNWRYAREHGVVSWLLLGEIVATAKAVIWPYYGYVALTADRDEAESVNPSFANSRRASQKALSILAESGGTAGLSDANQAEVVYLLESAVSEAKLVPDSFLIQVHADFPKQWKDGYTAALQELADGLRAGDDAREIGAAAKYNAFSEWVRENSTQLRILR